MKKAFLNIISCIQCAKFLLLFTGSTNELDAVVRYTANNFPNTKLVGVGFSLGGNILVKYLGENPEHQRNFVCAVSVCQGYDILK